MGYDTECYARSTSKKNNQQISVLFHLEKTTNRTQVIADFKKVKNKIEKDVLRRSNTKQQIIISKFSSS